MKSVNHNRVARSNQAVQESCGNLVPITLFVNLEKGEESQHLYGFCKIESIAEEEGKR